MRVSAGPVIASKSALIISGGFRYVDSYFDGSNNVPWVFNVQGGVTMLGLPFNRTTAAGVPERAPASASQALCRSTTPASRRGPRSTVMGWSRRAAASTTAFPQNTDNWFLKVDRRCRAVADPEGRRDRRAARRARLPRSTRTSFRATPTAGPSWARSAARSARRSPPWRPPARPGQRGSPTSASPVARRSRCPAPRCSRRSRGRVPPRSTRSPHSASRPASRSPRRAVDLGNQAAAAAGRELERHPEHRHQCGQRGDAASSTRSEVASRARPTPSPSWFARDLPATDLARDLVWRGRRLCRYRALTSRTWSTPTSRFLMSTSRSAARLPLGRRLDRSAQRAAATTSCCRC